MNNRTVEDATYELRQITEQLDDNRRSFADHYRKKDDVSTIFQEVTHLVLSVIGEFSR